MGPDYAGPPAVPVGSWQPTQDSADVARQLPVHPEWWRQFGDDELTELMAMAAQHNYSVRIAVASIGQSRGALRAARGGNLPSLTNQSAYARQRRSENTEYGQYATTERVSDSYNLSLDMRWEADLFGRIRRSIESREAALQASIYTAEDALISVQAETARTYFELRSAQQQVRIASEQTRLQQKLADLVGQRVIAGDAGLQDQERADSLVNQTRSQISQQRARARRVVNALAYLTGRFPEELHYLLEQQQELPEITDPVYIGMRSDILRQRPDIREAERELASRSADVGVATANLYPSFSLTGGIGLESRYGEKVFDSSSRTWTISPGFQWPIFMRGQLRALIDVTEARLKVAALQYEDTVYQAVQEAESALSDYGESLDTLMYTRKAEKHAAKLVSLVELRYQVGEDDLLDLTTAQQQLRSLRLQVVSAHQAVLTNLIQLYRALGGGWSNMSVTHDQ